MKVGTAGWSYLSPAVRAELGVEERDRLKAYAHLFPVVEVNSTFYRLPRLSTVERWRAKADEVSRAFEFTVKAYQGITHKDPFGPKAVEWWEEVKEIAKALRAKVVLFQTPASFKPTQENIERARAFFSSIEREGLILAWEVRWQDAWREDIVGPLFEELSIIHVVDPLRQHAYGKAGYYRLHGFGRPIYNYSFSREELEKAKGVIEKDMARKAGLREAYVIFNNYDMYRDARAFMELLKG